LIIDPSTPKDDEIDLGELLAAIWAYKTVVFICVCMALMFSVLYVNFIATSRYEAATRFEINEAGRQSFGELGGFASLAGIDINRGGAPESEKMEDRIFSRPFLEQISEPANLLTDPDFNGTLRPPSLRAQVFDALGLASGEAPTQAQIGEAVFAHFSQTVTLNVKKNGVMEVLVKHSDPERAAEVANIVVLRALQNLSDTRREETREKLEYFSEQLYDVRSDLDRAAQSLKDYALANNLRSQEELARSSAQLVSLRERRDSFYDSDAALAQLADIVQSGASLEAGTRDAFLTNFPVALSLDFRRLLGWSGAENVWTLPTLEEIVALRRDVKVQIVTMERTIRDLTNNAEQNASAATELEELRREIAVNEAMYEAMLKQFEGESLTSGFAVRSGNVIEMAVPPADPSEPRKMLVVALGAVLGLFLGVGAALTAAMRNGVLYTKRSVVDAFAIREVSIAPRALVRRPQRNLQNCLGSLSGQPMRAVEDLLVQLAPEAPTRVAVIPSTLSDLAINVTIALAHLQRPDNGTLCLLDFTEDGYLSRRFCRSKPENPIELSTGLFIVKLQLGEGQNRRISVQASIDDLSARFDRIVLFCPPPEHGTAVSEKVIGCADAVIVCAQSGYTTRLISHRVVSLLARDAARPVGLLIA
jgi:polysaccharide biosynthesis transport protein